MDSNEQYELDRIEEGLRSSPYSLPTDSHGLSVLAADLPRSIELQSRCQAVREKLAQDHADRLARTTRTTEIFESNAIEGKTISLVDTDRILEERQMWDADRSLARYTLHTSLRHEPKVRDVVGLAAARILVDQYVADGQRAVAESDLRDMHKLILRGDSAEGRYKRYVNYIQGSDHVPVAPSDVPAAMHQLVHWLRETDLPVLWKSVVAHAWLTHIHPFEDGNGRVARLLANYILGFGLYPPLIVRSSNDRSRYISALALSDEAGDVSRLARLFVRVLDRGISLMEKPDFAWSLFQADLRLRETDIFDRWRSTTSRFFEDVEAHLVQVHCSLTQVGDLTPGDYQLLRRRDKSGNGWFAKASINGKTRDLLVWIGFTSNMTYRVLEADEVFPSFFLAARDSNPRAIKPYDPRVLGLDGQYDELTLIPDDDRALIRRGASCRRVQLNGAAELYAAMLHGYLRKL